MAAEIDPRLKAIMDKLTKSTEEDEVKEARPESPRAPTTFEEFLEVEKLVSVGHFLCSRDRSNSA